MGTRLQFPKPRELADCSDPVIDAMIENLGGNQRPPYLACPADEVRAEVLGVDADVGDLSEHKRREWRVKELLRILSGDEHASAQAHYDAAVADNLDLAAQPRGLPETLRWSSDHTKCVARLARRKMTTFVTRRAAGVVCAQRQARSTSADHTPGDMPAAAARPLRPPSPAAASTPCVPRDLAC